MATPPGDGRERCGDLSSAKKTPEQKQVVAKEPPTVGRAGCIEGFGAMGGGALYKGNVRFLFPQGTPFKVDLNDFPHSLSGSKKVVYAGFC